VKPETLVRVVLKLTPEDARKPVTVFFAGPARERFQRVLSRAQADRFELGGFCQLADVPKGKK
jgi:hypothetical protein